MTKQSSPDGRNILAQSTSSQDANSARLELGLELHFSVPDQDGKTTMTIAVPDSPDKGWITIQVPVSALEAVVGLLREYRSARTVELPATIQGRSEGRPLSAKSAQ